jgi:hypothetical protein
MAKKPENTDTKNYFISNLLSIPVYIYYYDPDVTDPETPQGIAKILPNTADFPLNRFKIGPNGKFTAEAAASGAWIVEFEVASFVKDPAKPNDDYLYTLSLAIITNPNEIGMYPEPSGTVLIPEDGKRILVGYGTTFNGNAITREQFWKRSADSFVLARDEEYTIGFSTTSGMQKTTSEQDTISKSLGASSSMGWGPISASISASLSVNSTTFQQITVSTETTRYTTINITNKDHYPVMYLVWQITDVITIFDTGNFVALSTIVSAQAPAILSVPYNYTQPPKGKNASMVKRSRKQ